MKKICKRVDQTGSATERKAGSGRPKSTCSDTNLARVIRCWGTRVCKKDKAASTSAPVRLTLNSIPVTDQSVVMRRKIFIVWIILLNYMFVQTFLNALKSLDGMLQRANANLRRYSTIKCCWYLHVGAWWINKCIKFSLEIPCRCWENCQQA